ncbi:MAG TPA: patatin-like phospholipase family protein, partial [Kofleriaceae bacterium]
LLKGKLFDRLLRDMLPIDRIEAGRVPLQISVFDIVRRKTAVLRSGDLPDAIRASCAVPGLFHPVWIDRKPYWDGGILDRPGIAGIAEGERLLFHHIASRSPWRVADQIPPRRREMTTLVIDDLPRSGPTKLDAGRRALQLARETTRRALEMPIADGLVQIAA